MTGARGRSTGAFLGLLAALAVVAATPANAQTIDSVGTVKNAGNNPDEFQDGLTVSYQRTSSISVIQNTGNVVRVRYAEALGADAGAFSSRTETLSSDYSITFNVTAPGAYDLDITTSLNGAFTIVDDGDGPGTADASAVTGTQAGGTRDRLAQPHRPRRPGHLGQHTIPSHLVRGHLGHQQRLARGTLAPLHLERQLLELERIRRGRRRVRRPARPSGHLQRSDARAAILASAVASRPTTGTSSPSRSSRCAATASSRVRAASNATRAAASTVRRARAAHPLASSAPTARRVAASAGVCDPAETCTGSSAACPADAKSTAVCRASAGVCDVAENCDGVEQHLSGRRLRVRAARSAAPRPASATWPRTAPAAAPTCPADALAAERHVVPRRRPASATSPRTATARSDTCPRRRFQSSSDGLPRLGRRLRRGRELHRRRRRLPGRRARADARPSAARRPASATWPRTATARARPARRTASQSRDRLPRRRPAPATWPRPAPARGRLPGRRLRSRPAPSAGRRPAPATSPRPAPARRAARPTRSSRRAPSAAPSAGVCDVAENCTGVERRLPGRRLQASIDRLPRVGRRLRRRRELHRRRRRVPGRRLRAELPPSAARRPASATSPRTAPAAAPPARPTCQASRARLPARRPASATSPRTATARHRLPGRRVAPAPSPCAGRRRASATWPRTATELERPVRPMPRARPSAARPAGVCDVAESCDGVERRLPGRRLRPASTVCRPSHRHL